MMDVDWIMGSLTMGDQSSSLPSVDLPLDQHLPAEIWHSIFCYIDLTRQDIRNLTLTSHQFRLIAQPFLFASFSVSRIMGRTPYQTDYYLNYLRTRLSFAKSPSIVTAIRNLILRQFFNRRYPERGVATVPGMAVVETLFASLPNLHNLRLMCLEWLTFTPKQLSLMSLLPNLRELHLCDCQLDQSVAEVPKMSLQKLSLKGCTSQPWWMPLLRPDTCQQLQLHHLDDCLAAFAIFKEDTRIFAIETILLHCYSAIPSRHPDLVKMLVKMPYIQSFTFSYNDPREARIRRSGVVLPSEVLRLLTSITAPAGLLNTFFGNYDRPVRYLATTFDRANPISGGLPFTQLYTTFPLLETLSIHGLENFWESQDLWGTPFSLFSKLKVLHLIPQVISLGNIIPICHRLTLYSLPISLTELHVSNSIVYAEVPRVATNMTAFATSEIDKLKAKLPYLKHLLVLSPSQSVEWQNEPCSLSCYTRTTQEWFDDIKLI